MGEGLGGVGKVGGDCRMGSRRESLKISKLQEEQTKRFHRL